MEFLDSQQKGSMNVLGRLGEMAVIDWLQLAVFILVLAALTKPFGCYLAGVLDASGKTLLDPLVKPVERLLWRLLGLDPKREQDWKEYARSVLLFSTMGILFTYAMLRLQGWLPLNPQGFAGVPADLAFNTAVSFATNTNWQNYGGESTMSYWSQMVALTFQNFVSAAAGIAVAAALVRGIVRDQAKTIGNFWMDLTRICLYLLLPLSLLFAWFLVSQGMIQNFAPYVTAKTVEGGAQTLAQGPMASQVAIKLLGTNGGGFANANAAHPYENPTPLTNLLQMLAIFAIPSGLTYTLGRAARHPKHGWSIWSAMFLLFLAGVLISWWAESTGNPRLLALGLDPASGNLEGKEVRFGIFSSTLFATVTTDASCGAVNAMHDSFTPLGGLVPLFNMLLGEVVFGGVGAGLYGMLIFVLLAIFLAGLMVGRTPEYLGKKLEAREIKLAALAILLPALVLLGFTASAVTSDWGPAATGNGGPHGFTEIFYAYTSAVNNNGSAFAGLTANTPWYNLTLALAMLAGRFFVIVPVLALAGSLAGKKKVAPSAGTFPVSGITFTLLVIGTVLLVGALTYLPALALGPILEEFLLNCSARLY